jgi:hypothetical protein
LIAPLLMASSGAANSAKIFIAVLASFIVMDLIYIYQTRDTVCKTCIAPPS